MSEHSAGDPAEPIGTTGSTVGTVKWYRNEKGYGCIESEKTAPWDIWVHFSAIEGEGFRTLESGQRVDVEYERANQDSFRYRATVVRDHVSERLA